MSYNNLINLLEMAKGDRSLNTFAQHAGVSAGNLSRVFNGQKPSPGLLKKVASKAYNGITYENLLEAAGYINYLESQKNYIPILGSIKAGIPVLAEENWESQVEVPSDLDADFALRIKGDSMSWVGIHDGDLAILCHDNTASHGMIVAAGIEEMEWSATLKFYIKENGTPVLRAANPRYEDMPITPKHRIIGHVVSIMKVPPSINTYKGFLASKELNDEAWNEVTENAVKYGLSSKHVVSMIDAIHNMTKQIK